MEFPTGKEGPRLLDQVREAIRLRHYSIRTEQAYLGWIKRFIVFHDKRHPGEMGKPEIESFLTYLAVRGKVAASTQTAILNVDFFWAELASRAKHASFSRRCPVRGIIDELPVRTARTAL